MPAHYRGWDQIYLDIDPDADVDIVADLRRMPEIEGETFDAVYLCHMLEHFHPWEGREILQESFRVLKMGGFVEVRVPHVRAVFQEVLEGRAAMDEPLYMSDFGPVTPHDILYGHSNEVRGGNSFEAHKVAYTPELLETELIACGLKIELLCPTGGMKYELSAIGRKIGDEVQSPAEMVERLSEELFAN